MWRNEDNPKFPHQVELPIDDNHTSVSRKPAGLKMVRLKGISFMSVLAWPLMSHFTDGSVESPRTESCPSQED